MLISVSGLDGAGKSTLIAGLARDLEREGRRVSVLHMNDHVGIYAWLRRARDWRRAKPAVEPPPRFEPHPTLRGRVRDALVWSKILRRILYPLDVLAFLFVRLYVERIRGRVLIMDRYFYDRLVDVLPASTRKLSWAWVRGLARITPRPDLAVWLEITPDAAFARKKEYSIPYLTRRTAAYGWVFDWLPHAVRVTSGPPLATARIVRRAFQSCAEPRETQLRANAMRLLLDGERVDPDHVDWAGLTPVAEQEGVIVRLADALDRHYGALPVQFAAAASRACIRTQHVLEVVDRLSARCAQLGIGHAFLKTAERYPDSGRDIDLLVSATSPDIDRALLADLPAVPRGNALDHRIAGSRTYTAAYDIVVDIHHGRIGQVGEQARFARLLLDRAASIPVGRTSFSVPSAADHFLLLATQQVYTRPALRLADVYSAISMLRRTEALDWDYVFATALAMGMLPAVGAYLEYIDRMHARLFSRALLPEELLGRFRTSRNAGTAREQDDRYPQRPVARQLYVRQLQATVEAGRWHSAARLSLLPFIAGLRLARKRVTA